MNTIQSYKHFVAVLLMAVYAFVATPVQSWHSHNYFNTVSYSPVSQNEIEPYSAFIGTSVDAGCEICSHQYSTYDQVLHIQFEAPLVVDLAKVAFYYNSFPDSPLSDFANKGPPAIA